MQKLLSLVLVLVTASLSFGAGVISADLANDYQTILKNRVVQEETATQLNRITNVMSQISGQVLVQGKWGAVIWDQGCIEIWRDGAPLSLSYGVDGYGRLAFWNENISGVIDVVDDNSVYISIGSTVWFGEIVTLVIDEQETTVLLMVAPSTKCICKGTEERHGCQDADCSDRQPCSYEKNGATVHSECKWATVTGGCVGSDCLEVIEDVEAPPY